MKCVRMCKNVLGVCKFCEKLSSVQSVKNWEMCKKYEMCYSMGGMNEESVRIVC